MIVPLWIISFPNIKRLGTSEEFWNEGKEKTEIPEGRGGGSSQTPLDWKFQVDGGVKMKKPSMGGMDIFWNYTGKTKGTKCLVIKQAFFEDKKLMTHSL